MISGPPAIYLPGLNGLRAIGVVAVVLSHTTLALGELGLDNRVLGTDEYGNASGLDLAFHGVTIFFTLSGFLITYLLLKEKEIAPVNIKNFYVRRILRIWPLYYLYFFICIAVILYFGLTADLSSVPFYIFLAANVPFIIDNTLPLVAHYWSLGVEEQFYLLFPQIAKLSSRKLFRITIALIIFLVALKIVFWLIARNTGYERPYLAISVTRFHTILVGVAGAILWYNKHPLFIRITTGRITQIICWLCMLLITLNLFRIAGVVNSDLVSAIALCLIMGQITVKNRVINLENKPLNFIGRISYGMYVINPLIIFCFVRFFGKFATDSAWDYLLIYSLVMASTIVIAYLYYRHYESTFLRMKKRFSTVRSADHKAD